VGEGQAPWLVFVIKALFLLLFFLVGDSQKKTWKEETVQLPSPLSLERRGGPGGETYLCLTTKCARIRSRAIGRIRGTRLYNDRGLIALQSLHLFLSSFLLSFLKANEGK